MERATIGDDIRTLYEFDWEDGPTRTSDEIGSLDAFEATLDDIVAIGRDDPECEVRVAGFEQ